MLTFWVMKYRLAIQLEFKKHPLQQGRPSSGFQIYGSHIVQQLLSVFSPPENGKRKMEETEQPSPNHSMEAMVPSVDRILKHACWFFFFKVCLQNWLFGNWLFQGKVVLNFQLFWADIRHANSFFFFFFLVTTPQRQAFSYPPLPPLETSIRLSKEFLRIFKSTDGELLDSPLDQEILDQEIGLTKKLFWQITNIVTTRNRTSSPILTCPRAGRLAGLGLWDKVNNSPFPK